MLGSRVPTFKHFHVAPTTLDADTNPQRQHDTTSIANTNRMHV